MSELPPEQPRWRFAQMTPSEINQDPVQGEFFSRESDLPGRLVREAIQNSMDARRDGETVRVRFTFSGESGALPPEKAARYLDGLEEHVEAVVEGSGRTPASDPGDPIDEEGEVEAAYDALAHFGAPMSYLAIEDFGTTGLTGDIRENSRREAGNHFWGFFRSIGISPKGADDAGSWGLGKWVFPDASIINAYLGMTQRHGERDWLLMGMALLKTHELEGPKYRYYGFFADHSKEEDTEWFPMPVDSADDPDDFILTALEDFRLERMDDPGLSVIVPYPKRELTPDAIARAVVVQWFLPIVRGALVVEIVHPEDGDRAIDGTSIRTEVRRLGEAKSGRDDEPSPRDDESPQWFRKVIDLAEWASAPEREHHEIPVPTANANALADGIEELRERYAQDERLAFRLTFPQGVKRKGEKPGTGPDASFSIYLERDEELTRGHDYFVRGHLRLPHMDFIQRRKARALVLVEGDSTLGHLLRDAEGPAHVEWSPREAKVQENWPRQSRRISEVRNAAARLLGALVERPNELQKDALADLFPGNPAKIGKKKESGGGGTETVVVQTSGPRELEIGEPAGALVVRPSETPPPSLRGRTWTLRFAYDTTRGSPFKVFARGVKAGAPDFSLRDGSLHHVAEGCEVEITGDNSLRFTALDDEFRLTITGFDQRDLKVEVPEPVEEEAAEDAA